MNTPSLFKRKSQPYPDVSGCIGTRVGHFNGREWWHAVGPARDLFKTTELDITRQLNGAFADTYCSSILFHLYMIGKCKESARPTIMFFCEDAEPRKKAKKTIDQGGILERLPGFKTGHQAHLPTIGTLVLPATLQASSEEKRLQRVGMESTASDNTYEAAARFRQRRYEKSKAETAVEGQIEATVSVPDVYYDPTHPIVAAGMPIFVRHDNEVYRRATAYAVMKKDTCLLMTVSHVFRHGVVTSMDMENAGDDEFDFGSDTEDEMDEDLMEITSRASVSSKSSPSDTGLSSTTPQTSSIQSLPRSDLMDIDCSFENEADTSAPTRISNKSESSDSVNRFREDNVSRLEYLGKVSESCADQDWALITIAESTMAESLRHDLAQVSELAKYQIGTRFDDKEVLLRTSLKSQGIVGRLSGSPSYVRLAGSSTFEQLYHISLEEPIQWGDCGSVALGADTRALYGHVVASSDDRRVALIVPAHRVLKTSQTEWKATYRTVSPVRDKKRKGLGSNGGFKFITAEKPADFKRKGNLTTVSKQAMDHYLKHGKRSNPRRSPIIFNPMYERNLMNQYWVSVNEHAITIPPVGSPEMTLAMGPIVAPLPPGSLPYHAHKPPLFQSIGKALDPFQTMFQASYAQVSVEELKRLCKANNTRGRVPLLTITVTMYFGSAAMNTELIPMTLQYAHTFLGTLCIAAAYRDAIYELVLDSLGTTALRQEVIHLVGKNMLDPSQSTADHNLIAVTLLIASELISREDLVLKYHEDGIETMVMQRGGLMQLPPVVSSLISWLSIQSSILKEESPRRIYLDYCWARSRRSYPQTQPSPWSPIYLPHTMQSFPNSWKCGKELRALLSDMHQMLDIFLSEKRVLGRDTSSIKNLARKIDSSVNITAKCSETDDGLRYEAVGLTCLLLSHAMSSGSKLSTTPERSPIASKTHNLKSRLTRPIQYFDQLAKEDEEFLTGRWFDQSTQFIPDSTDDFASTSSDARRSPTFSSEVSSYSSDITRSSFSPSPSPFISHTARTSVESNAHDHFLRRFSDLTYRERLLNRLQMAIKESNTSQCWADMAGVLLWIALTAGAATRNSKDKILRKYFSALAVRVAFWLGFEHTEAILSTHLRMNEIIEALDKAHFSRTDNQGSTKPEKAQRQETSIDQ